MRQLVLIVIFLFTYIINLNAKEYASIGISSQKVANDSFSKGKALTINVGKTDLLKSLGVEVEGNIQIKKPKATISNITSKLKFWSMGMYGTYIWKFNKLSIKPRLGFVYEHIKSAFNTKNSNKNSPTNKSQLAISGGIGLSYKITNQTSIYTNYTKFEDDIEHLTFGAEFKF